MGRRGDRYSRKTRHFASVWRPTSHLKAFSSRRGPLKKKSTGQTRRLLLVEIGDGLDR